MADRHM